MAQQPTGGSVAAGQVSISQQPGKTTITQGSEKGVVNWQGFSVGKTESVDFIQPGRSSVTLNRVTGTSASNIEGRITATGQVMLINPNGVLFNQGSRVDVGGLVATTTNIRDADFLKGNYQFGDPSTNPDARVVNRGTINIQQGGYAALSAAAVENTGSIDAQVGTVVLGGAKTFTLDLHGDKLLSFRIDQPVDVAPAGAEALVDQRGKITATGGRVVLSARAAKGVIDKVVNMSGVVEAQAARMEGGEVVIDGGESAKVSLTGSVNVSGLAAGKTGGRFNVLCY